MNCYSGRKRSFENIFQNLQVQPQLLIQLTALVQLQGAETQVRSTISYCFFFHKSFPRWGEQIPVLCSGRPCRLNWSSPPHPPPRHSLHLQDPERRQEKNQEGREPVVRCGIRGRWGEKTGFEEGRLWLHGRLIVRVVSKCLCFCLCVIVFLCWYLDVMYSNSLIKWFKCY